MKTEKPEASKTKAEREEHYRALFAHVLQQIKPESESSILDKAHAFLNDLNQRLQKGGLHATAVLGGSIAKGTFLKGDYDVDIFVRFSLDYADQNEHLSDLLEKVLPAQAVRVHGSRDYFQLQKNHHLYEIVPVLHVSRPEEALNVTDMSPLHVSYVQRHIKQNPSLADEIRLAKQFCKARRVYGAESYIQGFSGHVLDLLLIAYHDFLSLLKAAAYEWGRRLVIDVEGHHTNPEASIEKEKRQGPLLLVDPVQPSRNAAAALSFKQYERFKEAARAFLEKPRLVFFTITPVTPQLLAEAYARKTYTVPSRLFIVRFVPLEGKKDVVATKLLKIHEYLQRHLQKKGFTILDEEFAYEQYSHEQQSAFSALIVKDEQLPRVREWRGPLVKKKEDAERFRQKHEERGDTVLERQGRLYALVPRKERTPLQALKNLLQEPYVAARAARSELLSEKFS